MKRFLPFFSYLFHPIFIPLLGSLWYVLIEDRYFTPAQYIILFSQIGIITLLLPILFFYLLRTFGKVDTIMLSDISQRKIPLLLQIVLFFILIERSITIERFPSLYFFFLGGLLSCVFCFLLLYLPIKTSLHMVAISALTVFIIGLSVHNQVNSVNTVVFFVVINGFVASSRLEMKAHTQKELGVGLLCGILPQLLLWYFWL